jgi:non-specific serine/threonine protein kinase/serine/threonine-protein kinase
MKAGDYAQAEKELRPALEMERRVLGPDHPNTAASTYSLACLEALQGKRAQALILLREALDHGLPSWTAKDIATDTDLKSLHGDPRFAALVARAQAHDAGPKP